MLFWSYWIYILSHSFKVCCGNTLSIQLKTSWLVYQENMQEVSHVFSRTSCAVMQMTHLFAHREGDFAHVFLSPSIANSVFFHLELLWFWADNWESRKTIIAWNLIVYHVFITYKTNWVKVSYWVQYQCKVSFFAV